MAAPRLSAEHDKVTLRMHFVFQKPQEEEEVTLHPVVHHAGCPPLQTPVTAPGKTLECPQQAKWSKVSRRGQGWLWTGEGGTFWTRRTFDIWAEWVELKSDWLQHPRTPTGVLGR